MAQLHPWLALCIHAQHKLCQCQQRHGLAAARELQLWVPACRQGEASKAGAVRREPCQVPLLHRLLLECQGCEVAEGWQLLERQWQQLQGHGHQTGRQLQAPLYCVICTGRTAGWQMPGEVCERSQAAQVDGRGILRACMCAGSLFQPVMVDIRRGEGRRIRDQNSLSVHGVEKG